MLLRGYLRQGLAAEKGGNIEAARWNYQRVLDHDGENEVAAQRLGLIAAEQGDDEEAVRYLKRAFHLDPDDLNTLLPLGFALVRQSSPDLAISMLSRAVALEPDNPDAHRCLGIACSTLGWYDAAEVQFRRTYKLDEKDAENAFNMAVLLATREPPRLEEAKKWYARAKELGVAADPGLDAVFGLSN
jgi:Flp pilus assembly protein TadD